MGRRRAFAFVAVGLGAAVRAACPAHCNFRGYCSAPDATLSTSFCICQPGVTGAACEQIHCPRGDDPLTQNQVSRAIALTVTAPTGGEVDGRLRFGFLGESVLLPAVLDAATCGRAISSLPTVQKASCSQTTDGWLVTFDEWAPAPVDAHAPHGGNPALGTFECESTLPGDAWDVPQCTLKDAVASNVREHAPCSNHGDCDLATGKCRCRAGWRRDACDDNKDADTLQLYRSEGPFYSGTILGLEAKRAASKSPVKERGGGGGGGPASPPKTLAQIKAEARGGDSSSPAPSSSSPTSYVKPHTDPIRSDPETVQKPQMTVTEEGLRGQLLPHAPLHCHSRTHQFGFAILFLGCNRSRCLQVKAVLAAPSRFSRVAQFCTAPINENQQHFVHKFDLRFCFVHK